MPNKRSTQKLDTAIAVRLPQDTRTAFELACASRSVDPVHYIRLMIGAAVECYENHEELPLDPEIISRGHGSIGYQVPAESTALVDEPTIDIALLASAVAKELAKTLKKRDKSSS